MKLFTFIKGFLIEKKTVQDLSKKSYLATIFFQLLYLTQPIMPECHSTPPSILYQWNGTASTEWGSTASMEPGTSIDWVEAGTGSTELDSMDSREPGSVRVEKARLAI